MKISARRMAAVVASGSLPEQLSALRELNQKQRKLIAEQQKLHKYDSLFDNGVYFFPSCNVLVLPNTSGKWRTELRQSVFHDVSSIIEKCYLEQMRAAKMSHLVVGDPGQYVLRMLREGVGSNCVTVTVEHSLERIISCVQGAADARVDTNRTLFVKSTWLDGARVLPPESMRDITVMFPICFVARNKRLVTPEMLNVFHEKMIFDRTAGGSCSGRCLIATDIEEGAKFITKSVKLSQLNVGWDFSMDSVGDIIHRNLQVGDHQRIFNMPHGDNVHRLVLRKMRATPEIVRQRNLDSDSNRSSLHPKREVI